MQLQFNVPFFMEVANDEFPKIILRFGSKLDKNNKRRVIYPDDCRPERVLIDLDHLGTHVRLIINVMRLPFNPAFSWLNAANWMSNDPLSMLPGFYDDVYRYFLPHSSPPRTRELEITTTPHGPLKVVHAKLVFVDEEAIVIGSPFSQDYFDTSDHEIDQPKRGEGRPHHDVSMAVRGPSVMDLYDHVFRLHWNQVLGTGFPKVDQIPAFSGSKEPATPKSGEIQASLQLVRTIDGGTFEGMKDGETGILEGYLRALENAENIIYIENQYFVNKTIARAIVNVAKARPKLQVILLVNVKTNIPGYNAWQDPLIWDMQDELSKENAEHRVRFFTAWTYEPGGQGKGKLIPIYVHSKVAIVDNVWATVGSANLDGSSLDQAQILLPARLPTRNHEANFLIFSDDERACTAVDLLRRSLWKEHLGFTNDDDEELRFDGPTQGRWVELWDRRADSNLSSIQQMPTSRFTGHVLGYPSRFKWDPYSYRVPSWPTNPRSYFAADYKNYIARLSGDISKSERIFTSVDVIDHGPSFSFMRGEYM